MTTSERDEMPSKTDTTSIRYGLIGHDTGGIRWYDSPEEVAAVWHSGEFFKPVLRVFRNGKIGHGSAAEVAPVYAALDQLRASGD